MKKLTAIACACLVLIIAGCVQGYRIVEVDGQFLESATMDMARPRAGCRTWVADRTDFSAPVERHMAAGDAFRICHWRGVFQLVPLRKLRDRWNLESQPPGFYIVMVESSDPTITDMLCGKFDLPGHDSDDRWHLLKLVNKPPNSAELIIDNYDDEKSTADQCDHSSDTHRGTVHVEN